MVVDREQRFDLYMRGRRLTADLGTDRREDTGGEQQNRRHDQDRLAGDCLPLGILALVDADAERHKTRHN